MRESTLKETAMRPIENPVEMGNHVDCLPEKLVQEKYYQTLFERAYGSTEVTEDRIATSLTEFLSVMTSHCSKFDRAQSIGLRHLSESERLGRTLFNGRAGSVQCHSFSFFDSTSATNNGLEVDYTDKGMALVTEKATDRGMFKTPSLRNIEVTGPYMYDGRVKTLEEVVDFYNEKIQPHNQLDESFRKTEKCTGLPASRRETIRLELNEQESDGLVAFMKSLTDYPLLYDKRFSNPFKK
jgi:cytochrome c peroxidase